MSNFENDKPYLTNFGIGSDDVPKEHIDFLKNNIDKKFKANKKLAGHIKQEYMYKKWPKSFEDWVIYACTKNSVVQNHLNNISILSKSVPYMLEALWINLQKKYEFNPIHDHTGVLSFIIVLKIPYDLKKEDKVFELTSPKPTTQPYCASRLSFLKNDTFNVSKLNVNVDKSYENKILVFPANLNHQVYPFYTSDDYRITASGNIRLYTG